MALRELIAELDVKVEGKEDLEQADRAATGAAAALKGLDIAAGVAAKNLKKATTAQGELSEETTKAAKATTESTETFEEGAVGAKKLAIGLKEAGSTALEISEVLLTMRSRGALVAKVLTTIAFSVVGLGFINMTKSVWGFVEATTEAVDGTGKLATTLGLGVESMQRWEHVAHTAGASNEDLRSSFKTLASQMNAAKGGSEGALTSFKALGVEFEDGAGQLRPLEDVMIDVTAGLGGLDDQSKKLALTQSLLSETALKMLPGFKGSTEEMRAQLEAMDALAGVYSEEFVRAAEETNDELHFMRNQFSVLRAGIVQEFLPSFRAAVKWVRETVVSFREFLKETDFIDRWFRAGSIAGLVRFASLLAAHWATIARWAGRFVRFISPMLRVIARFLAWALILDDIIVFLQGGESKLRDFLDAAFGIGAADKVLAVFRTTWAAVKDAIALAAEVLGWLWADFKSFSEDLMSGKLDNAFGGFGESIKTAINLVKDLWSWLDKVLGITETLNSIGETIFQAQDDQLNREAIARAQDQAKAAKGGTAPARSNSVTNVTDNSKVSVVLQGGATPETVRTATAEAKNLRNRKGTQNAMVRGTI